nr:S41 family peptidase [uncultured Carboxylicivirga sp.]
MNKYLTQIVYLLLIVCITSACNDNNQYAPIVTQKVNKFIGENMEFAYYWSTSLPNADYRYHSNTYNYFDTLLSGSYDSELSRRIDQWSYITDDYQYLVNYFAGVRKSMGHSIQLFRYGTNGVIGFIEYVEPNSPAANEGIQRGMMFYEINGQQLTLSNYSNLLNQESYTMSFGVFNDDKSISPTKQTSQMTAVVLQTNPIHISKVIDYEDKKIGYLMYNSFIDDYNDELESVFANFKAEGITELVLDLRYNGGGAVSTAILLSSMIAPSSALGDVFINTAYNDQMAAYYKSAYPNDDDLFTYRLQNNANNLNLNRLVVLTTSQTASASEMVIYGLSPHMTVYQIGEQTHGKYYGSITIHSQSEAGNWAIQPIVMRAENKDNSIDYRQGLIPNVPRIDFEDADTFYPLGDKHEDFLALALEYLTHKNPNASSLKSSKKSFRGEKIIQKNEHSPKNQMYISLPR